MSISGGGSIKAISPREHFFIEKRIDAVLYL